MKTVGPGYVQGGHSSITVQNHDVYIPGATYDPGPAGVYWKNQDMTSIVTGYAGLCTGIAVKGNDVYTVTNDNAVDGNTTTAVYRKNNNGYILPAINAKSSTAQSFLLQGNDVYVAGNFTLKGDYKEITTINYKECIRLIGKMAI